MACQHAAYPGGGAGGIGGGQAGQLGQRAELGFLHAGALAVVERVHRGGAAGIGHRLAFGAAQQQGAGAGQGQRGRHGLQILGVGVAADQHRRACAGLHQLDQAVRRVAQPDHAAHVQQALETGVQQPGGHKGHAASGYGCDGCVCGYIQRRQHALCGHSARLGVGAMHQHGQPFAGQQQCQQGREHGQLARTVVAGQHHGGGGCGNGCDPCVGGIQKPGHLRRGFALDAHGQAERAHFQVGDGAVQQLAHQVGGLLAGE